MCVVCGAGVTSEFDLCMAFYFCYRQRPSIGIHRAKGAVSPPIKCIDPSTCKTGKFCNIVTLPYFY